MAFVDEKQRDADYQGVSAYPSTGPPSTFTGISIDSLRPLRTRLLTCLFFPVEFGGFVDGRTALEASYSQNVLLQRPGILRREPSAKKISLCHSHIIIINSLII